MSADLPLDPNLRGLLTELAERPESMALGARVRRFQDVLRPDVLRPMTGMGVIETKLLEAHRDELAHLLLQASQVVLSHAVLLHPRDRNGEARVVDATRWRRAASSYVKRRIAEAEPFGPLGLLERALTGVAHAPTPRELAIASLRLVPRTSTTIWVGVHYGLEGDRLRGIEVQRSVLDDSISGFHSSYAWHNVGWLSNELGRHHDGLEAGRQATIEEPDSGRGPIIWLLSAVQLGWKRDVLDAAAALTNARLEPPEFLHEYIADLVKVRSRGLWAPTLSARSLVPQVSGHVPAEAEQLLEVFN